MRIRISGGKELLVFFNDTGEISVNLLNHIPSQRINFRKEVKNFLGREGRSIILKDLNLKLAEKHFAVFTEGSLTFLDILKLACWLEGGEFELSQKIKEVKNSVINGDN